MDEFEFQKDWDQEVRNAKADEAYEQAMLEVHERELEVHSMDPDQEPSEVAWEDDSWDLRDEAGGVL